MIIINPIRTAGLTVIGAALLIEPAFAGFAGQVAPAPSPIAGVGLPALVLIGGAYWLGRKFLSRKK